MATPPVEAAPAGCVPTGDTLFIPNVTTDVGLSPPYNSLFTLFGQFFDHGVDQTVKGGGTVFVPLKADDPLITVGPDGKAGTGDEVAPNSPNAFMVLTRAQNQPGPDGVLGTADDVQEAANTDSPYVDQSQTYTSHPSHQVFLREYVNNAAGRPVSTGKLLGGPAGPTAGGMATWKDVKAQAAILLGLKLEDKDVTNIPMIAADPYGKFIPGPARGLPQYVTLTGLVEGNTAAPVPVPANVRHFDTPFLTDIAHNADPSPQDTDHNPVTPPVAPTPDGDTTASADFANQPAGTYDDEMLNAHFCAGDGRVNENIGLTTIHQVFHSEHDRLVADIENTLTNDTSDHRRCRAGRVEAGCGRQRVERRAPVPGGPVRHGDGIPAPRLRGVRPQGPARDPAVPRLPHGHRPGHQGGVRPCGLPVRPLHADRDDLPDQRGRQRQLHLPAARLPEPARVHQRRNRRGP